MLEALAALSLASSIIQLVDFSGKLLKNGYDAYKSTNGADYERTQIACRVADLQTASQNLRASSTGSSASSDEKLLLRLATESDEISKKLLGMLDGLKVQHKGLARTFDSARKQFKAAWKSEKMSTLERELERIQKQVNTCLLNILRYVGPTLLRSVDTPAVPKFS